MERTVLWMLMCLLPLSCRTQNIPPEAVLNCCEGDVLFLLDSSGSVSSYEHSRMLVFLSELLLPFSLGEDQVRVGLLQVGTRPRLEFGFNAYGTQGGLQGALASIKPLLGDTNTVEALALAQDQVLRPGGADGTRPGLPRVLVWLTDGVKPGDVQGPMEELKRQGVSVLVVSTGHGNYQVLRQVVSPPVEEHLYFVDIDDMSIIRDDLRDAIIEIIRAERLNVRDVSTDSAELLWRPVLQGISGFYEVRFGPVPSGPGVPGSGTGTSPSTDGGQYERRVFPSASSSARLTGLKPDTTYTATLTPESNEHRFNKLSVSFRTKPEVLSPAVVTLSEVRSTSARVSWTQQATVTSYLIEYSALPRGQLHTLRVDRTQNSTLLQNLQPGSTYLVTITARHSSGKEGAISVKVCTEEVTPALVDLQLTTVGSDAVQVNWSGSGPDLTGYWLTWEGQQSTAGRSSVYLPPDSLSTRLTHLPPATRVCVSPVYKSARGDGLCCTARFHSEASLYGYQT